MRRDQPQQQNLDVFRALVWMYAYQGDLESALNFAKKAVKFGRLPIDKARLAVVYVAIGKSNLGYIEASAAYKKEPDSSVACYALGLIFEVWGDNEQARHFLEKATYLEPENFLYAFRLSILLKKLGNMVESKTVLENLAKQKASPELHSNVYWTLFTLANTSEEKIDLLRQLIQLEPESIENHKKLIRLLLETKQLDAAEAQLVQARNLTAYSSDGEYYLLQGDLFVLKSDFSKALRSYRTAQQFAPNDGELLNRIGCVLTLLGRDQAAIETFRQSITQTGPLGSEESKKVFPNHEKISLNRELAFEMVGMGPNLLWPKSLESGRKTLESFTRFIKASWLLLLISLLLSLATYDPIQTDNRSAWDSQRILIPIILFWIFWFMMLWSGLRFLQIFEFHPRAIKWAAYLLILYSPYLLAFLLFFVMGIVSKVLAAALLSGFFLLIMFMSVLLGAQGLSKLKIELTTKRISWTVTVSLLISIVLSLLLAYMTLQMVASLLQIQSSNIHLSFKDLFTLEAFLTLYFVFSIVYAITLLIDANLSKLRGKIADWRKTHISIAQYYKEFRKEFVQDWGLNGRIIDCLAWMCLYIPILLLLSFTNNILFIWLLWLVCMISLSMSIYLFIQYTVSPITFKRINIKKLFNVIKKPELFEDIEQRSIIMLVALSITLFVFTLFWINDSMFLFSYNYLYGDGTFSPNKLTFSVHLNESLFDWFYQTFRLMVNGDFDIQTKNPMVRIFSMPIALSNFLLLTLFFSQILGNLSELTSKSRDKNSQ